VKSLLEGHTLQSWEEVREVMKLDQVKLQKKGHRSSSSSGMPTGRNMSRQTSTHAPKPSMGPVCSSGCKFMNLLALSHTIWELRILKHNNFHWKRGDPSVCNPTYEKDWRWQNNTNHDINTNTSGNETVIKYS
jgi:hypothetical protein